MTSQPDLTRHESVKVHGRLMTPGTEFSIKGKRGRFRFVEYVEHGPRGTSWVTGYGGDLDPRGRRQFTSVALEHVRAVHTKKKMR